MAQQILHRADVVARLQQVRRQGMAQHMRRRRLGDASSHHRALEGTLEGLVV
jgi:hypothetical protein